MVIWSRRKMCAFRDEEGAMTIEAALWLPFFVILLTLIADIALIFHGQARALRIVQDANRMFSTGFYASADETAKVIEERMAAENLSRNAIALTELDGGIITSVVQVPTGDLDAIGFFTSLASIDMQISSQQVMEN